MILTQENYHSLEANIHYMSNSQYKDFMTCEAMAMATIKGQWQRPQTPGMLEGSYLDAWNDGELEKFKMEHPEVYKKDGIEMLAKFKYINDMIEQLEQDDFFMEAIKGDHQTILTADFFGTKWKIKMDTYVEGEKIVDLKFLEDFYKTFWVKTPDGMSVREDVFTYWGYLDQQAIYSNTEYLAKRAGKTIKIDGKVYPDWTETYIAAVNKPTNTKLYVDKEIVSFSSEGESFHEFIDYRLSVIEANMPRILAVKSGKEEPRSCGQCQYCLSKKRLEGTVHYSRFLV